MTEVKVLGKVIGNSDGWDQGDELQVMFMDFAPNDFGVKFLKVTKLNINMFPKKATLVIDYDKGIVQIIDMDKDVDNNTLVVEVDWSVFNS